MKINRCSLFKKLFGVVACFATGKMIGIPSKAPFDPASFRQSVPQDAEIIPIPNRRLFSEQDAEILESFKKVRERARKLELENPYTKRITDALLTNVRNHKNSSK